MTEVREEETPVWRRGVTEGETDEWSSSIVDALCTTDLDSMRESLLERILNQKKMELLQSPEVTSWLADKQRDMITPSQKTTENPASISVHSEGPSVRTRTRTASASSPRGSKRELRTSQSNSNGKRTSSGNPKATVHLMDSAGANSRTSRTSSKS